MIGIIPAAGKAERFDGLPKALLPVPQGTLIETLVKRMMTVPLCCRAAIGTNRLTYAYLRQRETISDWVYKVETETMSETVLSARGYVNGNEPVLFGMADTYFEDADAFVKLAMTLNDGADVAVGVFKTRLEQRNKLGMVEWDSDARGNLRLTAVVDKGAYGLELTHAWGVLAWKTPFWQFIDPDDLHVGYALPKAIAAGQDVRAVKMDGAYWDCGTFEEYADCISTLQRQRHGHSIQVLT